MSPRWNQARLAERRALVLEFKARGLSYDRIVSSMAEVAERADKPWLRANRDMVWRDINKSIKDLAATTLERAQHIRMLETVRYEKVLRVAMALLTSEDESIRLQAIDKVIRICTRIDKLYGVEAPQQVEVEIETDIKGIMAPEAGRRLEFLRSFGPGGPERLLKGNGRVVEVEVGSGERFIEGAVGEDEAR